MKIIVTEALDPDAMALLESGATVVRCEPDALRDSADLMDAVAIVIRTYARIDEGILDRAPALRVVGRAGVGLDNVDVEACAARGVTVLNTPDANTQAVVEYVVSIVMNDLRPLVRLREPLSLASWRTLRESSIAPRELSECLVGVLGLGRIGSRLASTFESLGARVQYHDLEPKARVGAVDFDALLSTSDILTIHVDGRASNRGLIEARAASILKPDGLLINTSRGFVIDDDALASHLMRNPGARAVLDVHDPEPVTSANPLLSLDNATLLPHLGAGTLAAKRAMSAVVADVLDALRGSGPST
ncbi:MAG: hypothetical protein KDA28_12920 [Phycisphaerales bacterium]|nr:hypothetical protein [Phycisphaerales bacterium]